MPSPAQHSWVEQDQSNIIKGALKAQIQLPTLCAPQPHIAGIKCFGGLVKVHQSLEKFSFLAPAPHSQLWDTAYFLWTSIKRKRMSWWGFTGEVK